jgi:putative thioredoxin
MTQRPTRPPADQVALRGAVDLAAVAAQAKAREQAASRPASASAFVIDVTQQLFQSEVIERSMTVPVVIDLWSPRSQLCLQLSPLLERLVIEYAGQILLARLDVDANPQLAQLFQAQAVPMVVAVIKGQPVPLFQNVLPEAQVRQYLDELLRVAAENGLTGTLPAGPRDPEADAGLDPDSAEPVSPAQAAAYEAIERGDFAAAATAFEQVLAQTPGDEEAQLGLAQVRLLQRTDGVDAAAARAAAAASPADPAAQIMAADLDLLGGHVEDAFARLVDAVRVTIGEDRNAVRTHLVGLFAVIGVSDPRVVTARKALTSALF